MVSFSAMPPIYYPLMAVKVHVKNLPTGSCMILALTLLLVSVGVIFHLAAKISIVKEKIKLRPTLMGMRKRIDNHTKNTNQETDTKIYHDTGVNQLSLSLQYRFIVPILPNVMMIIGLVIVIGILFFTSGTAGGTNFSFWKFISILIGVEGVIFPFWLIFRHLDLRSYAKRHIIRMLSQLIPNVRTILHLISQIRRRNTVTPTT